MWQHPFLPLKLWEKLLFIYRKIEYYYSFYKLNDNFSEWLDTLQFVIVEYIDEIGNFENLLIYERIIFYNASVNYTITVLTMPKT